MSKKKAAALFAVGIIGIVLGGGVLRATRQTRYPIRI